MAMRIAMASLLVICLNGTWGTSAMAGAPLVNATVLARMDLRFIGSDEQRVYLGIPQETRLSLAQIKADRLIIAILNTFCTICQEDAPLLNLLHQFIEADPSLQGRTKLVGIAPGNTDAEVVDFQKKHNVVFPIFADQAFSLGQAIPDNLRTPMFIIAANADGRTFEVIRTHVGAMGQAGDLLGHTSRSAAPDTMQVAARQK